MKTTDRSREYLNVSFDIRNRSEIPQQLERALKDYLTFKFNKQKDNFTLDSIEVSKAADKNIINDQLLSSNPNFPAPLPRWRVVAVLSKPLVIELQEHEIEVEKQEELVIV